MTKNFFFRINNFFAAATFTGCFFIMGCENDTKKINDWSRDKTMTEEATDIVSYLSDHGLMKAKLTAPYMLRVLTDTVYLEFPKSLHIDFYDSSKQIETRLDARYGKYFESLNKAHLKDSVVVINVKGDTLTSPEL